MGCTSSIEQSTYQSNTLNRPKLSKKTSGIVYYRNPSIKENITPINQAKSSLDCQFIIQVLRKHYIFYQLNETSIKYIIKHMFYCLLKQHQPMYQLSKTTPSCMFIIDKGLINTNHRTHQAGSIICDDNLLLETNTQITALEDTYMWGLDKVQFYNVLQSIQEQFFAANRAFLSQQYILQFLSPNQLDGLAANVIQGQYNPNQIMFSDEAYVIIKSGEASLFQGNQFVKNLSKRDTYGTLYQVQKRRSTKVRASLETQCLIITQRALKYVLGFNIQQQIYQAIIRYVLVEIEMAGCEIEKIIDQEQYKIKVYHNEKIKQRQIHEDLTILVDGYIDCEGEIMKIGEYVMDQFDNSEYIANGTVVVIAKDYLYLEDYVVEDTNDQQIRYRPRFNELKHLQVLRRNQKNIISIVNFQQQNFILRQINKQPQQKTQQDRKIKQYKKIFEETQSQYISQYYQFYEDSGSYYFLFEFVDGILLSETNLNIQETSKVIHQMISVVESCYKNSIICRSIKLDNFMYDGNIHLINFINAKQATRTYTIIDAPHYMAPEVLEGKGYDCNSDVWSVGVCLYELLFDCVPFGQSLDDPYQIYEEIINSTLEFPEDYKDHDGKALMFQLLNKNIYQRIGSNFDQLKNHKWFRETSRDSTITYIQEVRS